MHAAPRAPLVASLIALALALVLALGSGLVAAPALG